MAKRAFAMLAAALGCFAPGAPAQTVAMAPGSQIPGAPLPRYVYNVVRACSLQA